MNNSLKVYEGLGFGDRDFRPVVECMKGNLFYLLAAKSKKTEAQERPLVTHFLVTEALKENVQWLRDNLTRRYTSANHP